MSKVKMVVELSEGQDLEQAVNQDIGDFELFFQALGNEGLSGPERAILKTYAWFKTHPDEAEARRQAHSEATRGKEVSS